MQTSGAWQSSWGEGKSHDAKRRRLESSETPFYFELHLYFPFASRKSAILAGPASGLGFRWRDQHPASARVQCLAPSFPRERMTDDPLEEGSVLPVSLPDGDGSQSVGEPTYMATVRTAGGIRSFSTTTALGQMVDGDLSPTGKLALVTAAIVGDKDAQIRELVASRDRLEANVETIRAAHGICRERRATLIERLRRNRLLSAINVGMSLVASTLFGFAGTFYDKPGNGTFVLGILGGLVTFGLMTVAVMTPSEKISTDADDTSANH